MWLTSQTSPAATEIVPIVPEKTSTAPSVPVAANQLNQTPVAVTAPIAAATIPSAETKKVSTVAPISSKPTTRSVIKPDMTVPSSPAATIAVPSPSTVPAVKNDRLFEVNTQKADTPLEAYQNNPKYETALDVARDYYAKKNFTDAAIWAKKANQMNREAEEAWLLYAKSYYAQGKKTEAIGVLELYLNYKDSKAASELLRTWKLNSTN
jgi:hypothetical protein